MSQRAFCDSNATPIGDNSVVTQSTSRLSVCAGAPDLTLFFGARARSRPSETSSARRRRRFRRRHFRPSRFNYTSSSRAAAAGVSPIVKLRPQFVPLLSADTRRMPAWKATTMSRTGEYGSWWRRRHRHRRRRCRCRCRPIRSGARFLIASSSFSRLQRPSSSSSSWCACVIERIRSIGPKNIICLSPDVVRSG